MKHIIYKKEAKWLYCLMNEQKVNAFIHTNKIAEYLVFDTKEEAFNAMNMKNQLKEKNLRESKSILKG